MSSGLRKGANTQETLLTPGSQWLSDRRTQAGNWVSISAGVLIILRTHVSSFNKKSFSSLLNIQTQALYPSLIRPDGFNYHPELMSPKPTSPTQTSRLLSRTGNLPPLRCPTDPSNQPAPHLGFIFFPSLGPGFPPKCSVRISMVRPVAQTRNPAPLDTPLLCLPQVAHHKSCCFFLRSPLFFCQILSEGIPTTSILISILHFSALTAVRTW